jgi:ABC-type methionine transport system ATPase subunit
MQYNKLSPDLVFTHVETKNLLPLESKKLHDANHDQRMTEKRVRIKIPRKHYDQPIISDLAVKNGLKVNILSAILGSDAIGDGWFDLALIGKDQQINQALINLFDLDVEVWLESYEKDGW